MAAQRSGSKAAWDRTSSMAREAAHVTMLQRSPTYIVSLPARDKLAMRLRRWLPAWRPYADPRRTPVLYVAAGIAQTRVKSTDNKGNDWKHQQRYQS